MADVDTTVRAVRSSLKRRTEQAAEDLRAAVEDRERRIEQVREDLLVLLSSTSVTAHNNREPMTDPLVTRRSLRPVRNLTSPSWWINAGKRAARTALAAFAPLAALLIAGDLEPLYAVGVTALALVASLATSLANIPEDVGRVVPVWLAVLTRVVKTAAQTLAAALVGAGSCSRRCRGVRSASLSVARR